MATSRKKTVALLLWPLPVGWLIWFGIYSLSVDWSRGEFPDEEFWLDEAIFVALLFGSASVSPLIGVTAVVLFLIHTKKQSKKTD